MLQLGAWILLMSVYFFGLPSFAQKDIDPRLKDFQEDQQEKLQFDQQREAAKSQQVQEKWEEEQVRKKAQRQYVLAKAKTVNTLNSTVPTADYLEWLEERLRDSQRHDALRQAYRRQKIQSKDQNGQLATTLKEYGLDQDPPRVAWSQRKFGPNAAGSGGSPGFVPPISSPPPSYNSGDSLPPADYFEPDILPPPPDFDGGGLPPPEFFDPPPVYDGGSNFDPGFGQ